MIYQIKDWDVHFENSSSRKLVKMSWVPVPNKHDGSGYTRIMRTPDDRPRSDAAKIYSAWNLILQVASTCEPRGSLINKDGEPINSTELSLKTRAPKDWFDIAIPVLIEIGWISGDSPTTPADCPDDLGGKGIEGNRREGIEGKGIEPEPVGKEEIELIYKLYPSKRADGSSTGKRNKDKDKILKYLKDGVDLKGLVELYILKTNPRWYQGLSTFLNGLPDRDELLKASDFTEQSQPKKEVPECNFPTAADNLRNRQ
jgi:hypothetical protein